MMDETKEALTRLIEMPLAEQGFELADVVLSRYRNNLSIRLLLYGHGGVTVGDCARISRLAGSILDQSDLFPGGYALEVSSAGLDRPLRTSRDFRFRVGETVRVEFVGINKVKLVAQIVSADEKCVTLHNSEDQDITVPLTDINKAQIIF
ncbi:MAG: hypothetical protein DRP45_03880 [Candidatus Zixiibacteriota bacterium]|nr:MAG: hypothetical protein DRP45_03880 [candidate division Zixibacteria bacterium]